jgi:hypothetical protein
MTISMTPWRCECDEVEAHQPTDLCHIGMRPLQLKPPHRSRTAATAAQDSRQVGEKSAGSRSTGHHRTERFHGNASVRDAQSTGNPVDKKHVLGRPHFV